MAFFVVGVDPGPEQSAIVALEQVGQAPVISFAGILANQEAKLFIKRRSQLDHIYIESMQNYGMTMGKSTVDTTIWIGRFYEARFESTGDEPTLSLRTTIKTHVCGSSSAKDSHVREALIDRFGKAGTKKEPGPTYGIASHLWSALAVAAYGLDTEIDFQKQRHAAASH